MSDYLVYVLRSPRRIRQRFHVTIVDAGNRRTLFSSETLRDRSYALELAQRMAGELDATLVDAS